MRAIDDISARSLRRWLAENKTIFREVFESWRITTARQLLSKRGMPIASIAALLGYNYCSN